MKTSTSIYLFLTFITLISCVCNKSFFGFKFFLPYLSWLKLKKIRKSVIDPLNCGSKSNRPPNILI